MTRLNGLDQLREQEPHAFAFFLYLRSTNTSGPLFEPSLRRPVLLRTLFRPRPLASSLRARHVLSSRFCAAGH